jgi:F0F1-type ATP synthase assembly protein I
VADQRRSWSVLHLLGLGWVVVTFLLLGLGLGLWLDSVFPLRPLFTITGILLGTVAAFVAMIRLVMRSSG